MVAVDKKPMNTGSFQLSSLCVFCGAHSGNDPVYSAAARELGAEMAQRSIRLVYGGGSIGIMDLVASSVLAGGGYVTGVIPEFLDEREVGKRDIQDFVVTSSMHTRKAHIVNNSDAFAIMPGGLGTLEEAFEIITWRQLGLHNKPIIIVNVAGYWDPLLKLIDQTVEHGFLGEETSQLFAVANDVSGVFRRLEQQMSPVTDGDGNLF